jgi:hypothetical protein
MWMEELAESVDSVSLSEGARRLTLRRGAATGTWNVRRFARAPRPSEVGPARPNELFWVPSATPALRARLSALDIPWVTDHGEVHIVMPWGTVENHPAEDPADSGSAPHARVELSPGAAAVLQYLLEYPYPAPQTRIASAVGLTQPRVSQVMPELSAAGLAGRGVGGYFAADPGEGFEILRTRRATASVVVAGWYSVEAPRKQLAIVRERASAAGLDVRLCGDWAADLLAPWRQPGRIVVHTDATVDLGGVAFVPSPPEAATLEFRVEPIRASWRPAPEIIAAMTDQRVEWPVAPVTEVAREIAETGGSDADQAVYELKRAWLQARTVVSRGGRQA